MNDEENLKEIQFVHRMTTTCDHEWVVTESDPNSDMRSEVCSRCWAGRSVTYAR